MTRIVSVSAAPYDGYPLGAALDSLAACGVNYVEPAFIVGYTEPFTEEAFTPGAAAIYRRALESSGLLCHAFSAHMDLGLPDAAEIFLRRMDFARALGAEIINTNSCLRLRSARFYENIARLAAHGAEIGMTIGLENPGNGEDNLMNTAADGLALVRKLDHPNARLNFDPGNRVSQVDDGADPAEEGILALAGCAHFHVKDVRHTDAGWFFVTPGEGDIRYPRVLSRIADMPDLPISIEIPLRIHRGPDALPIRKAEPIPQGEIEASIQAGLAYVKAGLIGT
jgi:sugar phosphate isomerase/epimerase